MKASVIIVFTSSGRAARYFSDAYPDIIEFMNHTYMLLQFKGQAVCSASFLVQLHEQRKDKGLLENVFFFYQRRVFLLSKEMMDT